MKLLVPVLLLMLVACAPLPPAPAPEEPPPPEPVATPEVPAELPAAEPPPLPEPPAHMGPDEPKQVSELLAQYQRLSAMSAEDQRREYNTLAQAFNRDRGLLSRLRLALALSLPGSSVQDDGRAVGLLEPVAGTGSPLRQFAAFLLAQVSERNRAQKRTEQLKEQLDQLRAVERTIIERGRRPQPQKP